MNNFEQYILNKIDNNIKLSYDEMEKLVWEYSIDRINDNKKENKLKTIVKIGKRYFLIVWKDSSLQLKANQYFGQPHEVVKKEYNKIVHVVEWVEK